MRAILTLIVLFSVVNVALRGSKVLIALGAIALGASPLVVGIVAALFALFPMLLSVQAGRIADRIGMRLPIICGALVMTLSMLLPAVHLSLATLLFSPALLGLGHIFIHAAVQNGVGALSAVERRGTNYGNLSMGVSAAALVGPILAGVCIDQLGFAAGFAAMAAVAGLVMVAALPLRSWLEMPPAPRAADEPPPRVAELLAMPALRSTLGMSAAALTGTELFAFYIPIYGQHVGLSATEIGSLLGSYAAAAVVVRLMMGPLLRHYRETALLTLSFISAALFYGLTPFFGDFAILLAISFCLGLGLGMAGPLTTVLTYNTAPAGRSGEALGIRLTVNKFMQIVVPLGFGGLGAAAGVAAAFWANAAILLAGGLMAGRIALRGRADR